MSEEEKIGESREYGKTESPEGELGWETVALTETEIKTMEVHHHPHVEKKNFKEYLLEGLMIFLAVSMGFLAENFREHTVENQREKKFAKLLYNDLKADTASYNLLENGMLTRINFYKTKKEELLNSKKLADSSFARIATQLWAAFGFQSTSTTFNQMKTSGSLRYIRNDSVIANLSISFDKVIPATSMLFDYINEKLHNQIEPSFAEHFNIFDKSGDNLAMKPATVYMNRSETSDMIIKNKLFLYYTGINYTCKAPLRHVKERAIQLLKLLKEEYSIE